MLRPIKIQKHMNDILIIITCFLRLMPCFASDMLCVDFFYHGFNASLLEAYVQKGHLNTI